MDEIDQKIKNIDEAVRVMDEQLEMMQVMMKKMIELSSSHKSKHPSKSWTVRCTK